MKTVAAAAMPVSTAATVRGASAVLTKSSSMSVRSSPFLAARLALPRSPRHRPSERGVRLPVAEPDQTSKLIIFFITRTPASIHRPDITRAILPTEVVHSSDV